MYSTTSIEQVKQQVADMLAEQPMLSLTEMAQALDLSEAEVTFALPSELMVQVDPKHTESILQQLPEWGNVTTIVHSCLSIFEVKAPFPKGKNGHGYFNLMGGNKSQLNGHLKLDAITGIAFVSKPFRGTESHYIGFYNSQGQCAFKVYLGRNKKRELIPEQIEKFEQMKQELS